MSPVTHTDLQISLRICTDLELSSSSYVRAKESMLIAPSALSIKEAIRRISPVLLGEHTDLPFDVKA